MDRLMCATRGWGTKGSGLGLLRCVAADDAEMMLLPENDDAIVEVEKDDEEASASSDGAEQVLQNWRQKRQEILGRHGSSREFPPSQSSVLDKKDKLYL
mmetsp:Transcript_35790/g.86397  ORF Transcript_35790/g.86397 Transcript_35790/m.86397 type:complete len:99 (+) Transcript_35790:1581-1877(+)